MSGDFVPRKEAERVIFLKDLDARLDVHVAALNILPAVRTAIHDMIAELITSVDNYSQHKAVLKSLETIKSGKMSDTLAYIREQVARWKTEPGYTEAIGQELKIIGSSTTLDPHTYKPKLSAEIKPGYILLTFVKAGVDAVNIYYRVKGNGDLKFMARDTQSPYMDASPLASPAVPETREYMAIGVVGDEEFGLASDIVTAVYEGQL
jgi:uncharacterized protein YqgV (UPF0045/DUF77 family)